jgi:hypothetical protein
MRRYDISAMNILGHQELQLSKPDPGKKFLALIRYIIGAKALIEGDERMKRLVFGSFLGNNLDGSQAAARYFRYVHDYLCMTATPREVYEWERDSKHWYLYDCLCGRNPGFGLATRFELPLPGRHASERQVFLDPENHEGADLVPTLPGGVKHPAGVRLMAEGECLYQGDTCGCRWGKTAMFRHRQPDGGEVLSVYGHLAGLGELEIGGRYPAGYPLGGLRIDNHHPNNFLHFAVAYAATWRTNLSIRPTVPSNAGAAWIKERYLNPMAFLTAQMDSRPLKPGLSLD